MSKQKSKSTSNNGEAKVEKKVNPQGKVIVNRGAIMSAIEYAVTYKQKQLPIAKVLPMIDQKYKEDHYKDEWDFIFDALMTKPANMDLKQHLTNLKGRNK